MSYSPVNALLMSFKGIENMFSGFCINIFFCHHFICIVGYILTTVEGLQKINLERA